MGRNVVEGNDISDEKSDDDEKEEEDSIPLIEDDVDLLVAHTAAGQSDLKTLMEVLKTRKHLINHVDQNGWTPLHESIRGGNIEIVKFLLENGADINMRPHPDYSVLDLAKGFLDDGHEVITFLERYLDIS